MTDVSFDSIGKKAESFTKPKLESVTKKKGFKQTDVNQFLQQGQTQASGSQVEEIKQKKTALGLGLSDLSKDQVQALTTFFQSRKEDIERRRLQPGLSQTRLVV